ncbi:MAG: D-alanyl-D-alanine carboxypeptidase family protein, partial [Candidatus Competibacterales bacterium]|nr:D-alanyl-D-alanine carboxypeptidase family protein [Candidatus Competibacterales bacterium]
MPMTSVARFGSHLLLAGLLVLAPAAAAVVPAPPELPVSSYVLIDFHSGRTLAEKNGQQRLEPASITKLMSAYILYQRLTDGRLQPDDRVPVSRRAQQTVGSRMFIEAGTQVSVDELLHGMVIQSGNDATVALAEYVAGSETAFAQLMNQQARALGLDDTNFVNATGLPDPQHYTTAADIARLTRALIREFPDYYRLYSERSYTY